MLTNYRFRDSCGYYSILENKSNGRCLVYHYIYGKKYKVGNYKTIKGARIGLARYCGGLPYKLFDKKEK